MWVAGETDRAAMMLLCGRKQDVRGRRALSPKSDPKGGESESCSLVIGMLCQDSDTVYSRFAELGILGKYILLEEPDTSIANQ
jgi:hypothetical protein